MQLPINNAGAGLTSNEKSVYVERLLKLREILVDAPDEQYWHPSIILWDGRVQQNTGRSCGTAACAVGHAVLHYDQFPGLRITKDEKNRGIELGDYQYPAIPEANRYFGPGAWANIFDADTYGKPASHVTRRDAIQRIEDHITYGLGCKLIEETEDAAE